MPAGLEPLFFFFQPSLDFLNENQKLRGILFDGGLRAQFHPLLAVSQIFTFCPRIDAGSVYVRIAGSFSLASGYAVGILRPLATARSFLSH